MVAGGRTAAARGAAVGATRRAQEPSASAVPPTGVPHPSWLDALPGPARIPSLPLLPSLSHEPRPLPLYTWTLEPPQAAINATLLLGGLGEEAALAGHSRQPCTLGGLRHAAQRNRRSFPPHSLSSSSYLPQAPLRRAPTLRCVATCSAWPRGCPPICWRSQARAAAAAAGARFASASAAAPRQSEIAHITGHPVPAGLGLLTSAVEAYMLFYPGVDSVCRAPFFQQLGGESC